MKYPRLLLSFLLLPQALFAAEGQLPHDIRPEVEIGFRYTEEMAWIAGILLLAGLAWFLYRRWKKGKERVSAVPEVPVHVLLRQELTELAKSDLADPKEIKAFYFRLSEASRKTLELLGIGSVEQTYDEFRPALVESHEFPTFLREEIITVLERCEMVKFARYIPGKTVCEDDLALTFRLLDRYEEILRKTEEDATKDVNPSGKPSGKNA